ncbi:unnamed protein product [Calypogeia fissa]
MASEEKFSEQKGQQEEEVVANGSYNKMEAAAGEGGRGIPTITGEEVLNRLKESDPSEWLAAPPALVQCAKQASEILFSLTTHSFEKAPLSKLYTDRFDAEQIWQQIDLQSHPILSYIRKKLKNLEKTGDGEFFTGLEDKELADRAKKLEVEDKNMDSDAIDSNEESENDEDDEDMEEAEAAALKDGDDDEDDDEEEDGGEKKTGKNGVEDDFFRVSEMEKFLDRADAEGVFGTGDGGDPESTSRLDDGGDDDEDDDDDEEEEEGFDAGGSSGDEGDKDLGFGKYEDFFGKKKEKKKSTKSKPLIEEQASEDGSGDEVSEDDELDEEEGPNSAQLESEPVQVEKLSSHERRQEKIEKKMRQLEKASLDPKDWTLQGEVTAKKRPKNSALEVELDFEHNVRPPPVITEEVTASLEDMIKARITEARFDDVLRKSPAQIAAVRERVELDESKSQKGLGEIYEEEYMQQTGLAAAPTSATEAMKEEAKELFKALCARLDALSHFHYAPKPVIEDMEVRADVPALAMEEVAPVAVSEASMLAPKEIFVGEDAIKGEGELTPDDRKRRRAQKKRKRKGEKRVQEAERIRKRVRPNGSEPSEVKPTEGLKIGHSSYSKSTKVFAELENVKGGKGKAPPQKDDKLIGKPLHASFLKL